MLRCIGVLVVAFAAHAQIPGQYPGGQYPPGQYPGQSPIPRIPGTTGPTGRPRSGQPQQQPESRGKRPANNSNSLLTTTTGILRRAASNQLVIQSDDHRVIWF